MVHFPDASTTTAYRFQCGSIASGNLAEAGVLLQANPVRSSDEIGQSYHAMVKMSKNLNQIIHGIASNVTEVADQLVRSTEQFTQKSKQLLQINHNVVSTSPG